MMGKLQKQGKAIILMHDFQKVTTIALPQILGQLQKNGFKVVHMVPNQQVMACRIWMALDDCDPLGHLRHSVSEASIARSLRMLMIYVNACPAVSDSWASAHAWARKMLIQIIRRSRDRRYPFMSIHDRRKLP